MTSHLFVCFFAPLRYNLKIYPFPIYQAYSLAIGKKTQGEKTQNSREKTQTQAQNSIFQHIFRKICIWYFGIIWYFSLHRMLFLD